MALHHAPWNCILMFMPSCTARDIMQGQPMSDRLPVPPLSHSPSLGWQPPCLLVWQALGGLLGRQGLEGLLTVIAEGVFLDRQRLDGLLTIIAGGAAMGGLLTGTVKGGSS